ncbi:MAG: hypothetical protein EZS28_001855 [Streblomastix strix]|uniref:Uncharacterized protein n=1 Tax=Streblomastix strix TaxID=222440 RepID=A0A5J4X6G8_9EUKA|nr:MAG: hypothetical protein EZS28_001855 [Streblomastix strix]
MKPAAISRLYVIMQHLERFPHIMNLPQFAGADELITTPSRIILAFALREMSPGTEIMAQSEQDDNNPPSPWALLVRGPRVKPGTLFIQELSKRGKQQNICVVPRGFRACISDGKCCYFIHAIAKGGQSTDQRTSNKNNQTNTLKDNQMEKDYEQESQQGKNNLKDQQMEKDKDKEQEQENEQGKVIDVIKTTEPT